MRYLVLFFLFVCFLLPVALSAQQTAEWSSDFDTIYVSSYRIPMKVQETGRDFYILTADEIRSLPVTTVDEVLRAIPGLEVQARGIRGVQADFSLRGSTFSQVLVLIDGIRWNDPLTGHFNGSLPVSLHEIERIEVLKGPASALYGADAMGGVIHIISKTSANSHTSDKGLEVSLSAGEKGLLEGNVHIHHRLSERTLLSAGLNMHQADGHTAADGSDYWFNIYHGTAAINHWLNDNLRLFHRIAADKRDFSARYFYTLSPLDKAEEYTKSLWNQSRLSYFAGSGTYELDVFHKINSDRFVFSPDFPSTNEHTTQQSGMQLNHWRPLTRGLEFNVGLRGVFRQIESNDRGDHSDYTFSQYAAIRKNWQESTDLNLGLSLDYDSNFGWEINPQLSFSHRFDRTSIRVSAGRSIRAADYTERFISTRLPGPLSSGRNLGNPSLQAESALQLDAGMDWKISDALLVGLGFFQRWGTNIIDYAIRDAVMIPNAGNLDPEGWYFYAENLGEVNVSGIETHFTFSPVQFGQSSFRLSASYSFHYLKVDENIRSKYITAQARHQGGISLFWTYNDWSASLQGWYKNRETDFASDIDAIISSNYSVCNLSLGRSVFDNKGK
ncbi:MAG: TonB-dependent receptor, partial [Saprospirales bacterium]